MKRLSFFKGMHLVLLVANLLKYGRGGSNAGRRDLGGGDLFKWKEKKEIKFLFMY